MENNVFPDHLGMARNTLEVHSATTKYINQFFQEYNFTDIDELAEEHAEGENFSNLFEKIEIWFSSTLFRTHQNNCLGNASKEEQFKRMKEVFKHQFPTHEVFSPSQHDWFIDLRGRFKESCKHFQIGDADLF